MNLYKVSGKFFDPLRKNPKRVRNTECHTNISALISFPCAFSSLFQVVSVFCEVGVLGNSNKTKALHTADD